MLLNRIRRWLSAIAPRSSLEFFIIASDPQSIAEIERLTREYHYQTTKGML